VIDALQFEYETIVDERAHEIVFLVGGRELVVRWVQLADYDREGRFWLGYEVAAELGLVK
jgi:hypothetical protein